MYMPVVSRFRTYGVPLTQSAERYTHAIFNHPHVQELERLALSEPPIAEYDAFLQ
jgi:hypothetical protein